MKMFMKKLTRMMLPVVLVDAVAEMLELPLELAGMKLLGRFWLLVAIVNGLC